MQAIHQKIQSLGFKDCHAKIRHVDCQETISSAVVIQVLAAFIMISRLCYFCSGWHDCVSVAICILYLLFFVGILCLQICQEIR